MDIKKRQLLEVFIKASKNKQTLQAFLSDILTPSEYRELILRWQIVKLLEKKIPQRKIARDLKVAIATVTRGSRMLQNRNGGFNQILHKHL